MPHELAADAVGPKRHGSNCGIAFVYRTDDLTFWFADYRSVTKTLDATARELQAVDMGLWYLRSQDLADDEVVVYSDASRLFEYMEGANVSEPHIGLMHSITASVIYLESQRATVTWERVYRSDRDRYPLYLMADALSRHARTLDAGDCD